MKQPFSLVAFALVCSAAQAITVTATLTGTRQGTTAGGQSVQVCIYTYNNQTYEKAFPIGTNCPISIQLQ